MTIQQLIAALEALEERAVQTKAAIESFADAHADLEGAEELNEAVDHANATAGAIHRAAKAVKNAPQPVPVPVNKNAPIPRWPRSERRG